ncbi:MAG: DUF222 domain-containing protein, partial [Nakamurella sp.]
MGRTVIPTEGRAGELIDALRAQNTILCAAQARAAELMVEFADIRKSRDKKRISDLKREGVDPVFRAGEFAAMEISAAVQASKPVVHRVVAMARRLEAECPDAYDAWKAGNICQERALRINRALRRLVLDSSKQLLNSMVVDVAVGQTPELLGRWLNQFVARIEPDEQDGRLHRAMEDRYACIRPDLDGMSFLSALMSSVDAAAVDRILTALAAAAEPGDLRTMAQRRSDALVDMLCGRISNGCHVTWDANTDADDHLDDGNHRARSGSDNGQLADDTDTPTGHAAVDIDGGANLRAESDDYPALNDGPVEGAFGVVSSGSEWHPGQSDRDLIGRPDSQEANRQGTDWEVTDWMQPASAFRPDPYSQNADRADAGAVPTGRNGPPDTPDPEIVGRTGNGNWRVTPCPGEHQINPPPVTIGVVVSIQSLFGFSNTPGQLMDRSALVAADQIRQLAQQKGTLFYRLLTDPEGRLLDVTEMGRFPSRKL